MSMSLVLFAVPAALSGGVESEAIPYLVASGLMQMAFIALLGLAYSESQMSVVYPVARGLGPVLVLITALVFLGQEPTAAEVGGILLVAAGIVAVRGVSGEVSSRDLLLAGSIGVCIAGYTTVDEAGLEHAAPIAYLELALVIPAIAYPLMFAQRNGAARLRAAVNASSWAIALFAFGAYVLVLAALELADAAPVAAVRETSILIATATAAVTLGEPVTRARLAGAALIVGGVAALALGA
jgi:drug/metabolite transporter (DMT)-like permease